MMHVTGAEVAFPDSKNTTTVFFQYLLQGGIRIKLLFVFEWKPVYFIEIQIYRLLKLHS